MTDQIKIIRTKGHKTFHYLYEVLESFGKKIFMKTLNLLKLQTTAKCFRD